MTTFCVWFDGTVHKFGECFDDSLSDDFQIIEAETPEEAFKILGELYGPSEPVCTCPLCSSSEAPLNETHSNPPLSDEQASTR